VFVGVEMCGKCDDIHLIVTVPGVDMRCSVALTDDEWQCLIADYHKLRQVQLSPGKGRLQ
jgi:hypothetical protein